MTEIAEKKPNPFDLDAIRAATAADEARIVAQAQEEVLNSPRRRGGRPPRKPGFITLALDWITALKGISPHPPWGVALYLTEQFRRNEYLRADRLANPQDRREIKVGNDALNSWRLGREAKARDLRSIEAAGLIKIKPQQPGQSPRVVWQVDPGG
jgi:hypothetical protein